MAKTTPMRLIELMVHKEDIKMVLKYLGTLGEFQFQHNVNDWNGDAEENQEQEIFSRLEKSRSSLGIPELKGFNEDPDLPSDEDFDLALKIINAVEVIEKQEIDAKTKLSGIEKTYTESQSFANLKVPYSELENLSFLTMRIGRIDPKNYDSLKSSFGTQGVIAPLGNDSSTILAVCTKKSRSEMDRLLKKYDFAEVKVSKDFKGLPEGTLETLEKDVKNARSELQMIDEQRKNYAQTHEKIISHLLQVFSVGAQITEVQDKLESTQLVYRITGWLPSYLVKETLADIEKLTGDRTGARQYLPEEVESVINGEEKVPVRMHHGKLVKSFERMIFSYGSPLYGTVDPTPFVALFFTMLFGIMFGDAGQGLCFLVAGILMALNVIKVGGWNKFAPIFISIGCSSMIMGLLTGEFFATEKVLEPFSMWVTGLFGEPRPSILPMMPTGDSESIKRMFLFFGFSVAVGFVINTCGLIINIINQFSLKRIGKALFGKTGISGAVFFWYVVVFAVRLAFFKHSPAVYDWVIIGVSLLLTAFGGPLSRLVDGKHPVFEEGIGTAIIEGVVEVLEVVSSYLSNSVSFLRVGAFALAHAVLGFIIATMSEIAGPIGGIFVLIIGNAIVVVLEGMIVAIQVIRLQYYEFFSKFFSETGAEFRPFRFEYNAID